MNDSRIAIITDGSTLTNLGPTGEGAVIFRVGINHPPTKLAKAVSLNSTNYHGEIDANPLALNHIPLAQSHVSANIIHVFSDSIASIKICNMWETFQWTSSSQIYKT